MNTCKRHRSPHRYHHLCCLALLSVQPQARGNSHRDREDLLAERGVIVTRESIRLWCIKFGKQHYLWGAVDQDGEVVDVYLQARRDGAAVTMRRLSGSSNVCYVHMVVSPGRS